METRIIKVTREAKILHEITVEVPRDITDEAFEDALLDRANVYDALLSHWGLSDEDVVMGSISISIQDVEDRKKYDHLDLDTIRQELEDDELIQFS